MFIGNKNSEKKIFWILLRQTLYVNDILITGNCRDKIRETQKRLSIEFKIKLMGEPKKFLGIEISRDRKNRKTFLTQREFISKMFVKFGLDDAPFCDTPKRTNQADKKTPTKPKIRTKLKLDEGLIFRQVVASLLYLSNISRPDIAFAVGAVARKQVNPTLKKSRLIEFSDTDENGESTAGFLGKIFGDTIAWSSKKLKIIVDSTMVAE